MESGLRGRGRFAVELRSAKAVRWIAEQRRACVRGNRASVVGAGGWDCGVLAGGAGVGRRVCVATRLNCPLACKVEMSRSPAVSPSLRRHTSALRTYRCPCARLQSCTTTSLRPSRQPTRVPRRHRQRRGRSHKCATARHHFREPLDTLYLALARRHPTQDRFPVRRRRPEG